MKTYSQVRTEVEEKLSGPAPTLTCKWCNTPTASETLAMLGARCHPCYMAYCRFGYGEATNQRPAEKS